MYIHIYYNYIIIRRIIAYARMRARILAEHLEEMKVMRTEGGNCVANQQSINGFLSAFSSRKFGGFDFSSYLCSDI